MDRLESFLCGWREHCTSSRLHLRCCRRDTFFDLEYFGVHARRAAAGPGHYYARSGARHHRATISFISWLEVAVLQAVRVLTAGSCSNKGVNVISQNTIFRGGAYYLLLLYYLTIY